jgi:glycosyltransferase involved in cell wall biosynthesis
MRYLIWNECYVAGGADWSLIDLISLWPDKDDRFTLYINRTHEGLPLLRDKMPGTVEIREFTTFLEMAAETLAKYPALKFAPFRKLVMVWKIAVNYGQLKRTLAGLDYDAVLFNNGGYPGALTSYMVSTIARKKGVGKLVMIVRNYPPYHFSKILVMRAVRRICNRTMDRIITVSDSLKQAMVECSGIDEALLTTIHNGVSLDNKTADQAATFVPGYSVGIVGTLQARKGHRVLFEAWANVHARFPQAKLYVVGSPKSGDKEGLVRYAESLAISDAVVWIDFTSDIGAIYQALDVIVTPSLEFESFGRTLVEAMAFSKPAVASKIGGMVELIDNGVDGFLVDRNDPEALAERICRLLGSEATRKEMGKAGHAKYLRSFTADAMARKYHELFN